MRRSVLASLATAVAVLAVAASVASASTGIRIAPAGLNTAVPQPGSIGINTALGNAVCPVEWRGFWNELIPKRTLAEIGHSLGGAQANCAGWVMSAQIQAGWTMNYNTFLGRLPNITHILFFGLDFGIILNTFLGACLYKGRVGMIIDTANSLIRLLGFGIPKFAGPAGCPANIAPFGGWNLQNPLAFILV